MAHRFPFTFYNAALYAGLPALLPYYGWRAFRHGKYLPGLKERLGVLPPELAAESDSRQKTVWIHAVSVGEVLAARPLAEKLREAWPDMRFVVSTTTETGQARAREQLASLDGHFYFPLDLPGAVQRSLDHVRPSLVVILETEIWPNFLRACADRRIPVALVNGRISDRSFRRYMKVRGPMRGLLPLIHLFLMQSEGDADRIRALGAPPERVKTVGNLKYEPPDATERVRQDRVAQSLDEQFDLSGGGPLLIAGSTVEGEELAVCLAFDRLRNLWRFEKLRLLLAPRHPQRFEEVAEALERSGLGVSRRSRPHPDARRSPVILLDTVGELVAAYRFAEVVFVGGSLVPRGGHNILEPASYAKPVVTGPHTENFRDIMTTFLRADAVRRLETGSPQDHVKNLTKVFAELLDNERKRRELGARALATFGEQSGAAKRMVEEIRGSGFLKR